MTNRSLSLEADIGSLLIILATFTLLGYLVVLNNSLLFALFEFLIIIIILRQLWKVYQRDRLPEYEIPALHPASGVESMSSIIISTILGSFGAIVVVAGSLVGNNPFRIIFSFNPSDATTIIFVSIMMMLVGIGYVYSSTLKKKLEAYGE